MPFPGVLASVSIASDGTQANDHSYSPRLSADGRYVTFYSWASNLVSLDTNYGFDIFTHDRVTGQTTRVSVASDGTEANGDSSLSSLSADGRYVAFRSRANNLVEGDNNNQYDIFVHDRDTGQTTRVNVASDGTEATGTSTLSSISLSADGRYVTFESGANNLVAGDTNNRDDIFVHDRVTGQTMRVSVANDGTQANSNSDSASISADGSVITFNALARNFISGTPPSREDIFAVPNPLFDGPVDWIGSIASDRMQGSAHADIINGIDGDDILIGAAGNDTLIGAAGDDTLTGGGDDDTLNGGTGVDTAIYSGLQADYLITDNGDGSSTISHTGGTQANGVDTLTGVEFARFDDATVVLAAPPSVDLTGTDAADTLIGGVGDDALDGGAGDDHLEGGLGNDFLFGGHGDDMLIGDAGDDYLNGADGMDTLIGGDGADTLTGGTETTDRRDVIYGGAGNDVIDGGYGNDELRGDAGDDRITGGFGADTVIGGIGDDILTGAAFSDLLFGGDGMDFVNGGFGHDRVNGGAGADRFFHIGIRDHGSDWIQDYDASEGDVLLFGINGASGNNFQVNFGHTSDATGERSGNDTVQEAFVIYQPTGQVMWALVDGAGQAEINIVIGGITYDLLA